MVTQGDKRDYRPLQRQRIFCTEIEPWNHQPVAAGTVIIHQSAVEIESFSDGHMIKLRCPICGKIWETES